MNELEEIRIKIRNRYIICISIVLVSILVAIIKIPKFPTILFIIFFIMFIGLIITLMCTIKLQNQYRKMFKDTFVRKSLEDKFTDLIYEPDKGISYNTIAETKMIDMGDQDKYCSEDYISAKYKNIKLEQSDVCIREEHESTDSDGNTSSSIVTLFKGRWMIFDFNKEFKANVQVAQKGFQNAKRKRFFGKEEELFKKVSMESEEFNKKFNVFAQDEHDAFYILTPSLMERLEKLISINKGKIMLCFIDNKLHVVINDGKDSFEPGSVFKKIDEQKSINKISDEIDTITQFVDELNLDNTLFVKEVE